jgi:GNAT superfamily N-acetyltransferase
LSALVAELEARAFAAWPAARVEPCGGWRLRATANLTRRANSVWTNAEVDDADAAIARAEAFYAGCRQRAIFQLTPLAEPLGLDARLAARGYAVESGVSIQCAELAALDLPTPRGVEAHVDARLGADWLALAGERGRFAGQLDAFRALLERIGPRAGFALATVDGEPAATGLGVCEAGWLGVFAMATLPELRRRGAARSLLAALRDWASARGATRSYLQVERDNPGALDLYARAGYREVYGYHYRVK